MTFLPGSIRGGNRAKLLARRYQPAPLPAG